MQLACLHQYHYQANLLPSSNTSSFYLYLTARAVVSGRHTVVPNEFPQCFGVSSSMVLAVKVARSFTLL